MAQITTGIRSILSSAKMYGVTQTLVGAHRYRTRLVGDYLESGPKRILDIGCGPADVLAYLPESAQYVGFDPSAAYIDAARTRYGERGTFVHGIFDAAAAATYGTFDMVIALGVLHHLDDDEVRDLFRTAALSLRPKGCLLTVDPCFEPRQNPLARFVIRRDRGQNVRNANEYETLAKETFTEIDTVVRRDLLRIPYSHTVLICSSPNVES